MAGPVFISHSSRDVKIARAICEAIETRGVACWISGRDVGPGENFGDAIVDAIERAQAMVLVFSNNANNSEEIKKELALASQHRVTVIPVRVEDITPSQAFRYELATRQWIDMFVDWDQALKRLTDKIVAIQSLGRSQGEGSPPKPAPGPQKAPVRARRLGAWLGGAAAVIACLVAGSLFWLRSGSVGGPPLAAAMTSQAATRPSALAAPAAPAAMAELSKAASEPPSARAEPAPSPKPALGAALAAAAERPLDAAPSRLVAEAGASAPVAYAVAAASPAPSVAPPAAVVHNVAPDAAPLAADPDAKPVVSAVLAAASAPAPRDARSPTADAAPLASAAPTDRSASGNSVAVAPSAAAQAPSAPAPAARDAAPAPPGPDGSPKPVAEAAPSSAPGSAEPIGRGAAPPEIAKAPAKPAIALASLESLPPASKPALARDAGVKSFRDCDDCPEMIVAPSGAALIGSSAQEAARLPHEPPPTEVSIPAPFAIGRYDVTFDEWDACVADGGCNNRRPGDYGWGRGRQPVILVSWNDSQAYVGWLQRKTGKPYRLLSETEWEYAARGCVTTGCASQPFWFGAITPEIANYDARYAYLGSPKGLGRGRAIPVDEGAANPFGLVNMLGNVRQWVQDCWSASPGPPPAGGAPRLDGDCADRVTRGGSYNDKPQDLRAAARSWETVDTRSQKIGFRVARALDP